MPSRIHQSRSLETANHQPIDQGTVELMMPASKPRPEPP